MAMAGREAVRTATLAMPGAAAAQAELCTNLLHMVLGFDHAPDPGVSWSVHVPGSRFGAGEEGDIIKCKQSDPPESSSDISVLLLWCHCRCPRRSARGRWGHCHGASLPGARYPSTGLKCDGQLCDDVLIFHGRCGILPPETVPCTISSLLL